MAAPDQNYYPDTGGGTAEAPEEESMDTEDTDTGESVGETALVPKNVMMGKELNPGDTVTFKVVKLYEDEVELQPVSEKKEEPKEMTADEEIDMMAVMPMKKGM